MSDSAAEVASDLAQLAITANMRAHGVVVAHGALLKTAVKRRAAEPRTNPRPSSSPEGPRLLTGDYSRSITRANTRTAKTSETVVGTNKAQGPRLEFGFRGTDSRGRTVNQRAYPHFGPALDEIAPAFLAALEAIAAPLRNAR